MERTVNELYEMTLSGLNLIKQAISIHDSELKLRVSNRQFQTMFNLPDHLVKTGAEFRDILTFLAEKGEYGEIDNIPEFVQEKIDLALGFQSHYFERAQSNGRLLSIEGNPLSQGGWISVYTDITEVKQQEDFIKSHAESLSGELIKRSESLAQTNRWMTATVTALEATKQELTKSREQLNLINTMTPAHIAYVNAEGIYTHSNGKLHTVLPKANAKIVGSKFSDTLGAAIWLQVEPRFESVMQGNPSISELYDAFSGRYIRLAMTPDLDEDGVHGCYILSMDVTDEVSARTALAHARRRELATQLTSGMAHDFSNLLTIIMGQQAQLEARASQNPEIAQISATIESAAKRGAELIESLSLLDSQRNLDPVAVNVPMFITNFRRLACAAVAADIDLQIVSSLPHDRLMFDPGFAQDAMLNLVLNAAEAMDLKGRVHVQISRAQYHMLEVTVRDEGPGFSPEGLNNALAPFYSTKTGKVGRGLGLSAAFDFAKSCGGTLHLRNRPSGGAAVSLRIPYIRVKTKKAGLVLLVDDDDDVRETVRQHLRQAGHAVIEAVSVAEAEKLMQIEGVSHVVTDLSLSPTETGLDVAKLLPDGVPILVITGLPRSDTLRQAAEQDHVVLSKPFSFDALENALSKAESI